MAAVADLTISAQDMRADAVVGITLGVYSGGIRSMQQAVGVHMFGTAVRLRVDDPAPES
jgi:uncharacterized protein YbjQ (UPF0145 family)